MPGDLAGQIQIAVSVLNNASAALESIAKDAGAMGSAVQSAGQQAQAGMAQAEAGATKAQGGIASFGKSVQDNFGQVAVAAVGIHKAADAFSSWITEAGQAQAVGAQTAAVLKSTGDASGLSAKQVGDYANALSKATGVDDENVQSAENLLLTFRHIGGSVMPAATAAVLDLSQSLGQDLKTSAVEIGKALDNPIQGMTALQRVGITFTQSQKDAVAAMMAAGDQAGAEKIILAELNAEVGGSAVAFGKTLPGSIQAMHTAFGNAKEALGGFLAQGLQPLIQLVTNASEPIKLVTVAFLAMVPAILGVSAAIAVLESIGAPIILTVAAIAAALALLVVGAYEAQQHWDQLTAKFPLLADAADKITTALDDAKIALSGAVAGIEEALGGLVLYWENAFLLLLEPLAHLGKAFWSLIHGDWAGAWNEAKSAVDSVGVHIQGMAQGAEQYIMGLTHAVTGAVKEFDRSADASKVMANEIARVAHVNTTAQLAFNGTGHEASLMAGDVGDATRALINNRIAVDALADAQDAAAGTYQTILHLQSGFTSQASEYQSGISAITAYQKVLDDQYASGALNLADYTQKTNFNTEATARYAGGVQDATVQGGELAAVNAHVMIIQDQLHSQYPGLIAGTAGWKDQMYALGEAHHLTKQQIDDAMGSTAGLQTTMGGLEDILGKLIKAVGDLTTALGGLPSHVTTTVEAHFITTGNVQGYGAVMAGGNFVGITQNAEGGLITQPTLGIVGEAGPELIIPVNKLPHAAAAKIMAGNTGAGNIQGEAGYLPFIKQVIADLAGASDSMGDAVGKAKTFADSAKSALDLVSSALSLLTAIGSAAVVYGPGIEANLDALKRVTEKSVQSLEDSSVLFKSHGLAYLKTYDDAAKSALDVMTSAVGFVKALGDTTVLYGQWQEDAIANLKFIAEKAVQSLGDSAAIMDVDFVAGVKAYAEGAGAALTVLKGALDLVKGLGDTVVVWDSHMDTIEADLKFIAEKAAVSIGESAQVVDTKLVAGIKDYADGTGAAVTLMGNTLKLVTDLSSQTGQTRLTSAQLAEQAQYLAGDSRIIADQFVIAAQGWDTKITPAVKDFADAAGASLNVIGAVPNALKAIMSLGDTKKLDVKKLAAELAADVQLMIHALQDASKRWDKDALVAVTTFADGAGKAVALMLSVADAMTKMATVSYVSHKQADIYMHNIRVILDLIHQLAQIVPAYLQDALTVQQVLEAIAAAMTAGANAISTAAGTTASALSSGGQSLSASGGAFSGVHSGVGHGNSVVYVQSGAHQGHGQEPQPITIHLHNHVGDQDLEPVIIRALSRAVDRTI